LLCQLSYRGLRHHQKTMNIYDTWVKYSIFCENMSIGGIKIILKTRKLDKKPRRKELLRGKRKKIGGT